MSGEAQKKNKIMANGNGVYIIYIYTYDGGGGGGEQKKKKTMTTMATIRTAAMTRKTVRLARKAKGIRMNMMFTFTTNSEDNTD